MKLNIFSKVLFRVPQFPKNTTLAGAWPELKRSIKDASSYFYNLIKDLEYEDIAKQPPNVRFTIAKYFNRAKYRATPYGTFAGIGIAPISHGLQSELTISGDRKEYRFRDWRQAGQYAQLWKELPLETLYLQANSSHYRVGDVIRYIYKNEDRFELSDMPYYPEIDHILKACSRTLAYSALAGSAGTIGLDAIELKEIVSELIESQLLFTNLHPNIIGAEYFERIGQAIREEEQETYTICKHELLSGGLKASDYRAVAEAVSLLHRRQGDSNPSAQLASFIDRFSKRYDMQTIPIMEALDPVIGIGYGDLERPVGSNGIVDQIITSKQHKRTSTPTPKLTTDLLSQLAADAPAVIRLEKLPGAATAHLSSPLPNTLSAIAVQAGALLIVDSLGGTSATTLLGRFNLTGGETEALCKEIAHIEQQGNPDVVFFDLAYMGEPRVDNINRRRPVYDHQVCILGWDDGDTRINLDDIRLLVRGSTLILYSTSLKKRLIPRMSTAYNYTRSDLSLFRLLCDIQAQDIAVALLPEWKQSMPDAKYYPRIQYKNVVLSRASWKVTYSAAIEDPKALVNHLRSRGISQLVKVGYADQTLLLDLANTTDMSLLVSVLKAKKELWLHEAFEEADAVVCDRDGNAYCSELILSFYHEEEIYKGITVDHPIDCAVQRSFPPGSEWIYFKLFCSTSVSNSILVDRITPVVHRLNKILRNWFFIRYDEGGDHLRLRFRPLDGVPLHEVTDKLYEVFRPLFKAGMLQGITLSTYHRELERYGPENIEQVERHFTVDADCCLILLSYHFSEEQSHWYCVSLMAAVGASVFGPDKIMALIHAVRLNFQKEHQADNAVYRSINNSFSESETGAQPMIGTFELLKCSFVSTLLSATESRQEQLFVDLFHMHINRLFARDQRIHEYIIYEYLCKSLKKTQHVPALTSG